MQGDGAVDAGTDGPPSRDGWWRILQLDADRSVLQVGADAGLTGALAATGASVLVLEPDDEAAAGAGSASVAHPHVQVVRASIDGWRVGEAGTQGPFDLVFWLRREGDPDAAEGFTAALEACVAALRPSGVVAIATAKRGGLASMLGGAADPAGIVPPILERQLVQAGLAHQRWLLAYPDHRQPSAIVDRSLLEDRDGREIVKASVREPIAWPAGRPAPVAPRTAFVAAVDGDLAPAVADSVIVLASRRAWALDDLVRAGSMWLLPERRLQPAWQETRALVEVAGRHWHTVGPAGGASSGPLFLDAATVPAVAGPNGEDLIAGSLGDGGAFSSRSREMLRGWWAGMVAAVTASEPRRRLVDLRPRHFAVADDGSWHLQHGSLRIRYGAPLDALAFGALAETIHDAVLPRGWPLGLDPAATVATAARELLNDVGAPADDASEYLWIEIASDVAARTREGMDRHAARARVEARLATRLDTRQAEWPASERLEAASRLPALGARVAQLERAVEEARIDASVTPPPDAAGSTAAVVPADRPGAVAARRLGGLRFAALLGTKDEADILPLVIDQLRDIGVELIVVLDVGSTDGTLAYLREAERAGDLWVLDDRFDRWQRDAGRGLQAALAQGLDAEWLLLLDSDELPLPRGGSLHDLDELDDHDVLAVPRYNVVLGPEGPRLPERVTTDRYDDLLLYAQPIPDFYRAMRRDPTIPWIRGVLEPKTLVRAEAVAALQAGRHDIDSTATLRWRRGVSQDLLLAHLPFRDLERFEMRAANLRAEVDADPEFFSGWSGWQWQRFAQMSREGRTLEEFERQVIDRDELAELRTTQVVRSAREVLDAPITPADGPEAWDAMAARAEPWLTATGMVSRRERVRLQGKLEHLSGAGRFPSVLLPPDHVVRFYGPWHDGAAIWQRERALLQALESDESLPVPRPVASGTMDDELRYLVLTRVPGVALRDLEYEPGRDVRLELARWTGAFARSLRATSLPPALRDDLWQSFEASTRPGDEGIAAQAMRLGVSDALVRGLAAWLPPIDELVGRPEDAVLCHGALGQGSLMGQPAEPGFEPTGVVDFSHAFVGPPLADLGAVWGDLLAADPEALAAFLEASGLGPLDDEMRRHALAWVLLHGTLPPRVRREAADIDDPEVLATACFGQ
jgi:hypothetical protein